MAYTCIPKVGGMTVKMPCAGTVDAGEAVKTGATGVTECGDGDTMFGIALQSGASGDNIAVWFGGIFEGKAAAGTDFGIGDRVYLAAQASGATRFDAGSATNLSAGIVVESDPASGGTITVLHDPQGLFAHA